MFGCKRSPIVCVYSTISEQNICHRLLRIAQARVYRIDSKIEEQTVRLNDKNVGFNTEQHHPLFASMISWCEDLDHYLHRLVVLRFHSGM